MSENPMRSSITPARHSANRAADSLATGRSTRRLVISNARDIVGARKCGRMIVHELEGSDTQATLVATVISELARNMLHYAGHGEILLDRLSLDSRQGIAITATDRGPGIVNINQAMDWGYSSSGGLGLGLPGVREIAHEFEIVSGRNQGVRVKATLWFN